MKFGILFNSTVINNANGRIYNISDSQTIRSTSINKTISNDTISYDVDYYGVIYTSVVVSNKTIALNGTIAKKPDKLFYVFSKDLETFEIKQEITSGVLTYATFQNRNNVIDTINLNFIPYSDYIDNNNYCFIMPYYEVEIPKYTITKNGDFSLTKNDIPEKINRNTTFSWNITANNFYGIQQLTSNIGNVAISNDTLTANIEGTATENINLYIACYSRYYTSSTNVLRNCTINPETGYVLKNSNFKYIITADDGYTLYNPSINIGTYLMNEENTQCIFEGVASENIEIKCYAAKVNRVLITGTIINATCNYSNNSIIEDGKNLVITANDKFEFQDTGYDYYENSNTKQLVLSKDKKTLSIENPMQYNSDITLWDDYTATPIKIDAVSDFVFLYNPTKENLNTLSTKRFYQSTDNDGKLTYVDYGKFITALYTLPLEIPTYIIGGSGDIILGFLDTNILVDNTLTADYFYLSFGKITINEEYNNVYDYKNTNAFLYLPFSEPIELDIEYVINQTITIDSYVNLYKGIITYNIYSTFNNNKTAIETKSIKIGLDIPFIEVGNYNILNNESSIFTNTIDTALIEIVRNIPYYSKLIEGKETIDYDLLQNKKGFIRVSEINLNTVNASDIEKQEIEQLLKDGIFILESEEKTNE